MRIHSGGEAKDARFTHTARTKGIISVGLFGTTKHIVSSASLLC